MPAGISVTPLGQGNTFPFGPVITTLSLTLIVVNIGDTNLVYGSPLSGALTITNGNGFSLVSSPAAGTVIAPGGFSHFVISFTPSSPVGTENTATLQINSNSVSGPTLINITGITAQSTDVFAQLTAVTGGVTTPAVISLGNLPAGVPAGPITITVKNPTSAAINVSFTPLTASGYSVSNILGTNPIPPGGTLTFDIHLTPAADMPNQDDPNAVVVNIPSQTYITNVEVTYSTLPITPVFTIGGTDFEMLLGFFSNAGAPSLLQADPSDLDCEEDASFTRQYDFKAPDAEKQLQRLLLRYERFGPATVTVTYASVSPENQASITQTRTFDTATDGLLRNILYDGSIAGEVIQLTFTCLADDGPVSVVLFAPYVEPRGEFVEAT
jgi:hypothetical protein